MPTLEELLDIAVPATTPATDFEALAGRGTRRRHAKRATAMVAVALVVAVGWTVIPRDPALHIEPVAPESVGLWQAMAPSPLGPRIEVESATDGSRMFVWGGLGPVAGGESWQQEDRFDGAVYDAATDSWIYLPAPPEVNLHWSEWLGLIDGYAVLLRSSHWNEPAQSSWRFDLESETWQQLPEDPFPDDVDRDYVPLEEGPLVVAGDGTVAQLDVHGGRWMSFPGLPDPVAYSTITASEEFVFVFGGTRDAEKPIEEEDLVGDGWLLDLNSRTWTKVESPLTGRTHPSVDWLGGRFLVYGGSGPDVAGWEPTTTVSELPDTHECDGDRCAGSSGALIGISPGEPAVERADGAWFDPRSGTWELLDPGPWIGTTIFESLRINALDPTLAEVSADLGESGSHLLVDVATGRRWSVESSAPIPGLQLSDGSVLAIPWLERPLIAGEPRLFGESEDVLIFRELEDGVLTAMQVPPPQRWGSMETGLLDRRVVLWNGALHANEGNRIDWLDGGWILDLSDGKYALER